MRRIENKKYFMTSVEFESLVNKGDNKLISGKKIIIDEKIFSDIDSFENFSFKLEKEESNNNSSSSSDYSRLIDNYENNNRRTNYLNKEYLGSYLENIAFIECDIYLGKNLIIIYDIERNIIII